MGGVGGGILNLQYVLACHMRFRVSLRRVGGLEFALKLYIVSLWEGGRRTKGD